jgi:hypothetical protein
MRDGPLRRLRVIPEPEEGTASVLVPGDDFTGPFITGVGPETYVCGSCTAILLLNVTPGQIVGIVFQCPVCKAYNAT